MAHGEEEVDSSNDLLNVRRAMARVEGEVRG